MTQLKYKAWSSIALKTVDEAKRVITGVASTPTTDRAGDVVEPMGAQFELPLPFLYMHDHSQPVGHVTAARPAKDGIPVTIQMARTDEPGTLKDRLDEAWQSIKLGLVRGLSIGFAPVEYSLLDTGGIRFTKWNWLELSGVTIPCNSEATIQTIKAYDSGQLKIAAADRPRAALSLREKQQAHVDALPPGVRKLLDATAAGIAKTVAPLQARVDALESAMRERKYFGVWESGEYKEHNMCSHQGSMWVALRDTEGKPGETEDWQLAVKRGRDAR